MIWVGGRLILDLGLSRTVDLRMARFREAALVPWLQALAFQWVRRRLGPEVRSSMTGLLRRPPAPGLSSVAVAIAVGSALCEAAGWPLARSSLAFSVAFLVLSAGTRAGMGTISLIGQGSAGAVGWSVATGSLLVAGVATLFPDPAATTASRLLALSPRWAPEVSGLLLGGSLLMVPRLTESRLPDRAAVDGLWGSASFLLGAGWLTLLGWVTGLGPKEPWRTIEVLLAGAAALLATAGLGPVGKERRLAIGGLGTELRSPRLGWIRTWAVLVVAALAGVGTIELLGGSLEGRSVLACAAVSLAGAATLTALARGGERDSVVEEGPATEHVAPRE